MKYAVKAIKAEGNNPHEILVYGPIGKSWWSDEGISAKEFVDALNEVPRGQKVTVGVNSQGGAVGEGSAIYSAIARRSEDVTVRVDGYALSIASFFPLAAARVVTSRASIWMIHKAWNMAEGNADQFRKNADMLDVHDRTIVNAYIAKTGKSRKEVEDALSAETWMTGEEAVAWGLADEEGTHEAKIDASLDFAGAKYSADKARTILNQVSAARRLPAASATQPTHTPMNAAVTKPADAQPPATPAATPAATPPNNDHIAPTVVAELRAKIEAQERRWAEHQVDAVLASRQSQKLDREDCVKKFMADASFIDLLRRIPEDANDPVAMGYRPSTEGPAYMKAVNDQPKGKRRFHFIRDHWDELRAQEARMPRAANTGTSGSSLTTALLVEGVTTVLQNRLAPLMAFAREFAADRIKPLAKLQHKKVTAGGTAQTNPTSFEDTTNFVGTITNTEITMNQYSAGGHITNAELNSGFRMADWSEVKAGEIGDKVMAIALGPVTTANFTATPVTQIAAGFTADDLKTLWGQLKKASRKNIVLDGEYFARFIPGNMEDWNPLQGGSYPGWDGFYLNTVWTGAGTNVRGFACHPQAVACGYGLPLLPESAPRAGLRETVITIDGLGAQVALNEWFGLASRVDWATYDIMFGAAANDTTAGVIVKSA